jgi:hypothetical protein
MQQIIVSKATRDRMERLNLRMGGNRLDSGSSTIVGNDVIMLISDLAYRQLCFWHNGGETWDATINRILDATGVQEEQADA